MHVGNLASTLTKVDSGEIQDQLDERLQAFAEGEIDHASEAFSSLWKTLTHGGGGTVETPRWTGLDFVRFSSFRGRLILIYFCSPGTTPQRWNRHHWRSL